MTLECVFGCEDDVVENLLHCLFYRRIDCDRHECKILNVKLVVKYFID